MATDSRDLPSISSGEGEPPSGRALSPRRRLAEAQNRVPLFQLAGLVGVFIIGAATIPGFAGRSDIYDMLTLAAFLGFAAAGQTIVVLIGGIDLSIPGMIALSGTMLTILTGEHHWSLAAALGAVIATALLTGGLTGLVCHFFGAEPLIVTLGVSAVLTGIVAVWTGGFLSATPPTVLEHIVSPASRTFGIGFPPLVVIWLVLALLLGYGLKSTAMGRRLYATGANPLAARRALVSTLKVWVSAYALCALMSALTGVLLAGFAAGDQSVGDPYLFESLAAVIVGGTAFGGRGDYWRTVLGALILTEVTTLLIGHGYSDADQQMLFGVVILVVVAAYGRDRRLRDRV